MTGTEIIRHTGIPWSMEKSEFGFSILGTLEEGPHHPPHDCGLNTPRRRVVCTVHGTDSEGEANARLIVRAAASRRACAKLLQLVGRAVRGLPVGSLAELKEVIDDANKAIQ